MSKLPGIKVFPSQANYVMIKIENGKKAEDIAIRLLDESNIFIKDLSSKKGFDGGQFIRLAVRNSDDNDKLIAALKEKI